MSPWLTVVTTLAGVNLVRAARHPRAVAAGAVVLPTALALLGAVRVAEPAAFAASVAIGAAVVACWQPFVLRGGRGRQAVGLLLLLLGAAAPVLLLGAAAASPPRPWLWAAALLVLADPATRVLRWTMGLIGRPLTVAAEVYGRGEAVGVLERWLTLVVLARGDYGALGFIIAAKALARHKRFETDPDFAEYFLVGTLASVLVAVAVAEALRALA